MWPDQLNSDEGLMYKKTSRSIHPVMFNCIDLFVKHHHLSVSTVGLDRCKIMLIEYELRETPYKSKEMHI